MDYIVRHNLDHGLSVIWFMPCSIIQMMPKLLVVEHLVC